MTTFIFNVSFSMAGVGLSSIPSEYGQVIYRYNEGSPKQLFIIGMSHRDSITRLNGSKTSRVQAEVYKIGEWLVQKRNVELLLPEGFFVTRVEKIQKGSFESLPEKQGDCIGLDLDGLEEKLSDNRVFVNAEILLKRNYPLRLQQVEDKGFYDAVKDGLSKFVQGAGNSSCDYPVLKSELDYLQERRTGAMLQRIPEIVYNEFQQGTIKSESAVFTIGMSHIPHIIKYLNENRVTIYSPLVNSNGGGDYIADLNLSREGFGVTVIIPRTLLSDRKALEMNKLDKIVLQ
jgi:hypothetical protein